MLLNEEMNRTKRDKEAFLSKLKPGVILYDSWGYDQTQVEFYRVESINNCTVILQELGHTTVKETGWASCTVMPDLDSPQGVPVRRIIRSSRVKINDSISLTLWDGQPKYKSWYA